MLVHVFYEFEGLGRRDLNEARGVRCRLCLVSSHPRLVVPVSYVETRSPDTQYERTSGSLSDSAVKQ